jgi:hypothetical protein
VDNCLRGYNSAVLAYGMTGSGKTHTMLGELPRDGGMPDQVRTAPLLHFKPASSGKSASAGALQE